MFFWIPALIPLLGIIILLFTPLWPVFKWEGAKSWNQACENWKKFGVYALVNLLGCMVIACIMWAGAVSKQYFPEVWNYKAVSIKHEKEWTEKESRTRQVYCGTDEDGNAEYRTETYYVTEHYGPYWKRTDEYGNETKISQGEYEKWKAVWNNEIQIGIHKGSSAGWDKKIDGPIYECKWTKTFETIYPLSDIHRYVNKIRVSNSVFKYGQATEAQRKMYPRPADKGNTSPIVNYGGLNFTSTEELMLRRVNAELGRRKEIHALLIVFSKDTPRSVVDEVLTAWQGPNKNELCTFLSLDGKQIKWVEVHSWMDNTTIHAMLRDGMVIEPFSVQRYAELLREYCPKYWHRKSFEDFDYIKVSINPSWFFIGLVFSWILGVVSYIFIEANMSDDGW